MKNKAQVFLAGDIIVPLKSADGHYSVTISRKHWVGTVVQTAHQSGESVLATDMINTGHVRTETLECDDANQVGETFWVLPEHFKIKGTMLRKRRKTHRKTRVVRTTKHDGVRSLLQVAKSYKVGRTGPKITNVKMDQEIELALAWVKDEITVTQVQAAIGKKPGLSVYLWLNKTLKRYVQHILEK